jgi:hypothetical protein
VSEEGGLQWFSGTYIVWRHSRAFGYGIREGYVAAVNEALSSGKIVTTIITWYLGFYTKVTAYAK